MDEILLRDKDVYGRKRAKGKSDPLRSVCQVADSLFKILCVCNRPSLCHHRTKAFQSVMELLTS
jgi:hypothetical protein